MAVKLKKFPLDVFAIRYDFKRFNISYSSVFGATTHICCEDLPDCVPFGAITTIRNFPRTDTKTVDQNQLYTNTTPRVPAALLKFGSG